MKRTSTLPSQSFFKKSILLCFIIISSSGLYSFTIKSMSDDFLKRLGISKPDADEKISRGLLGGSLDTYGVKNLKNILRGSQSAITKDILAYTKKYTQSAVFKKQYETMRQHAKPESEAPKTPEELREESIAALKKAVNETEANLKKADQTMKPVFERVLAAGKKQLADAESPTNKQFAGYEKGYPQLVKDFETRNKQLLKDWEAKYPTDPLQYIKPRLEEFLVLTEEIDFDAVLITKGGKKIFANPVYERKDDRWKMAFRAGKEVVQPARAFVQEWLKET